MICISEAKPRLKPNLKQNKPGNQLSAFDATFGLSKTKTKHTNKIEKQKNIKHNHNKFLLSHLTSAIAYRP